MYVTPRSAVFRRTPAEHTSTSSSSTLQSGLAEVPTH